MAETLQQTTFTGKTQYTNPETYVQDFIEALRNHKVLHYQGVPKMDNYQKFYQDLALSAGSFVKQNEDYNTGNQTEVDDLWLDIRFDEKHRTETFRHSDTHQPLHTDGAYNTYSFDISFFFCLEAAPVGGGTTFIDGEQLVEIMKMYEPELLKELETTDVIFDKGDTQKRVAPIIGYDEKGVVLNFNWFRVSDKNSVAVKKMCDRFHNFLESKIHSGGLLTPVYLKPGEAVFFHDYRVLHGRNAFFGPRCLIKGGINLN